jgi:hypothetical protein
MALNDRIFYACQAVIIMPMGTAPAATGVVNGLQSVGMSSNFTLDQIFEIGQLEIYENVEDVADIEVTLEKVLDGYELIFEKASVQACRSDLVAAAKARSDVYLGIFDDSLSNASGIPRSVCWNSGMYTSSVSYAFSIDGNATESVTMVGNDRFWNAQKVNGGVTPDATTRWNTNLTSVFDGADFAPSGVTRRTDVDLSASLLPAIVESQGGTLAGDNNYHIQSINISADFGQENILELGRFGPYAKFVSFPIEVSCDFEVIATSGDLKSVSGIAPNLNTPDQIVIRDTAGHQIDLGSNNKLASISYSGGDTGGGNATVSYSFTNFNSLLVSSAVAEA